MWLNLALYLSIAVALRFTAAQPSCKWTQFYDRDTPGGTGDYERLSTLRREFEGEICEKPLKVDARLIDGRQYTYGGDTVTVSPSDGIICINTDQRDGICNDYKVRFCCDKVPTTRWTGWFFRDTACTWTRFYNRDGPSGDGDFELLSYLMRENPGEICEKPFKIDARLSDGRPYTEGGDVDVSVTPTRGLVCKNVYQRGSCNDYKVRFCC